MTTQRKHPTEDKAEMNLTALRDSFGMQEEVHVQFRAYGGSPSKMKTGTIIGKDHSFATVRFDRNTQKIPYTRLLRCRQAAEQTARPQSEEQAPARRPATVLRAVPPAFEHLEVPAPRAFPVPVNRQEPDDEPDEQDDVSEPLAASTRQAHEATPTLNGTPNNPDDMAAWLDMGRSLLPTLEASEARLREEAQQLAEEAQRLMDSSDAKIREADRVKKHAALLTRLHE